MKVLISDIEAGGGPFEAFTIDAEGIALDGADGLLVSSEGNVERGVRPFVARFSRDGSWRGELALGARYRALADDSRGVRHNLAFESLSVEPGGRFLFTATENALVEDGPAADLGTGSPVRILRSADGMSPKVAGLFPAGEGSGYAGGITSSAVDGIRAADELLDWLQRS